MTDRLKLGKGFSITVDEMLQRWAILGMSGAGKSNTAVVMVEEMYKAGIPFCVIDPKGDWWGVRSSKTGKSAGLDIPIFGGEHGDIPLYADGGAVMADAVAAQEAFTQSIIDVSQFEDQELLRFLMDFAERIYKVNRLLIMLVLEEADEYIPQNKESPEQAKSVGKWSRIVKRGRTRGLLTVLVALRNSELAKSVLNFSDSVIVHRATAKLDREAVKGWVEYSGASKEILDSMPTLDDGEAWVSSPQKLKVTKRVRIDRRHTFDSGATPDLDTDRARVTLKQIDLSAIQTRMKATIERAKAEDPTELRKRIAALERELAAKPDAGPAPEPVEVKVPVLDPEAADDLQAMADDLRLAVEGVERCLPLVREASAAAAAQLDQATSLVAAGTARPSAPAPRPMPTNPPSRASRAVEGGAEVTLRAGARRMLEALARLHPTTLTRAQLGTLADVAPGGTFSQYLNAVYRAGLAEEMTDRRIGLSEDGIDQMAESLGSGAPGPEQLEAIWGRKVRAGARRMLRELVEIYPEGVDRATLGERAEVSPGGTFSQYLNSLKRNNLAAESGGVVYAGEALFLGGR